MAVLSPLPHLSIHRYTLRSQTALNAKSVRNKHEGALIRAEYADGCNGGNRRIGYGCIHPWEELGDIDLERTLRMLAEGEQAPLARRALDCARQDAVARSEGRSLFEGLAVPMSHATLIMNAESVVQAVDAGFQIMKLKVGRALAAEVSFIREQSLLYPEIRWRFDFNHTQSIQVVRNFLDSLGANIVKRVDFVEDAYLPHLAHEGKARRSELVDLDSLNGLGVPVAVDRSVDSEHGSYDVAVIKPAVHDVANLCEEREGRSCVKRQRIVFTSYMDHPVGQCFAAYEAAKFYKNNTRYTDVCGLMTHGLFEVDSELAPFVKRLGLPAPEFLIPEGAGLGFDDLLENALWTKLI